jgi:hypothetical protein
MFAGASAFDQDLSGWCFDGAVYHDSFAQGARFEQDTQKHPSWTTCPRPRRLRPPSDTVPSVTEPPATSPPLPPSTEPSAPPPAVDVDDIPSGGVLVVSGSTPVLVTVDSLTFGQLLIRGEGFNVGFPFVSGSGTVAILPAASPFVMTGAGFLPTSVTELWLSPVGPSPQSLGGPTIQSSAATYVGGVVVSGDGTFSGELIVPASVSAGQYVLQIVGVGANGEPRVLSFVVEVAPAAPIELPVTGGDVPIGLMLLAAAVLASGVVVRRYARG